MYINIRHHLTRRNASLVAFACTCVIGSFVIGIQTAGDVHSVNRIEAQQANIFMTKPGDIDGDGEISVDDAITALQLYEGRRKPDPTALAADPNRDGSFTLSDVYTILTAIHR